jgi:hypothetical protein
LNVQLPGGLLIEDGDEVGQIVSPEREKPSMQNGASRPSNRERGVHRFEVISLVIALPNSIQPLKR